MSYLNTGLDILNYALFRCGEQQSTLSRYYNQTKFYVTKAFNDVMAAAPFPFALKQPPGVLQTTAKVTNTLVSVSYFTWTFSDVMAESQTGKKIMLDGEEVVYRITGHVPGTATLDVDALYTEGAAIGPVTIFQDEYQLAADCIRPWYGWLRNIPNATVEFTSGQDANLLYPTRIIFTQNFTYRAAIIQSTSQVQQVRLTPWTADAITIEYSYSYRPVALDFSGAGSGDVPLVPYQDLYAVADLAAHYLALDKDDSRAEGYLSSAQTHIALMVSRYIAAQKPRFRASVGSRIGASN